MKLKKRMVSFAYPSPHPTPTNCLLFLLSCRNRYALQISHCHEMKVITRIQGTQPLPPAERRTFGTASYGSDRGEYHVILGKQKSHIREPGYQRDVGPQRIPDKPPYLAHLGNLDYDVNVEDINQLLEDCEVTSVRLIEDRELK